MAPGYIVILFSLANLKISVFIFSLKYLGQMAVARKSQGYIMLMITANLHVIVKCYFVAPWRPTYLLNGTQVDVFQPQSEPGIFSRCTSVQNWRTTLRLTP
jgi:hypothetical protein